jgi:hypothetical protein
MKQSVCAISSIVNIRLSTLFSFQTRQSHKLKAAAKMPSMRRAIEGSIQLLKAIDDPVLWLNDDIINFFEVTYQLLNLKGEYVQLGGDY